MKKQIRVLIGDDGTIFSVSCANSLRTENIWVYTRQQTQAAIYNSIQKERPDMIVLDVTQPTMDFLALLRGPVRENGIAMLVFSLVENSFLERQLMENGALAFLKKPLDAESLGKAIMLHAQGLMLESSPEEIRYNIEVELTKLMHRFGVPAHVRGYYFLRASIMLSLEHPEMLRGVTKHLYPSVAAMFDTMPTRVERAIRHAIELSWERGDIKVLNDYFGATICSVRGRPTNSEFIAMVADKLRLEYHCDYLGGK